MSNTPIEIVKCSTCNEEHYIYSYDVPGQFTCSCGRWLEYNIEFAPDYDAEAKDNKQGGDQ